MKIETNEQIRFIVIMSIGTFPLWTLELGLWEYFGIMQYNTIYENVWLAMIMSILVMAQSIRFYINRFNQ